MSGEGARIRRRQRREGKFGPQRAIVQTVSGVHLLECGHRVLVHATENPHIRRRRCGRCLGGGALVDLRQEFSS